jgi:hypothetical protein
MAFLATDNLNHDQVGVVHLLAAQLTICWTILETRQMAACSHRVVRADAAFVCVQKGSKLVEKLLPEIENAEEYEHLSAELRKLQEALRIWEPEPRGSHDH